MTNKKRVKARKLAKKSGMSYAAAVNVLNNNQETKSPLSLVIQLKNGKYTNKISDIGLYLVNAESRFDKPKQWFNIPGVLKFNFLMLFDKFFPDVSFSTFGMFTWEKCEEPDLSNSLVISVYNYNRTNDMANQTVTLYEVKKHERNLLPMHTIGNPIGGIKKIHIEVNCEKDFVNIEIQEINQKISNFESLKNVLTKIQTLIPNDSNTLTADTIKEVSDSLSKVVEEFNKQPTRFSSKIEKGVFRRDQEELDNNEHIQSVVDFAKNNTTDQILIFNENISLKKLMIEARVLIDRWANITEKFILNPIHRSWFHEQSQLENSHIYLINGFYSIWAADIIFSDLVDENTVIASTVLCAVNDSANFEYFNIAKEQHFALVKLSKEHNIVFD